MAIEKMALLSIEGQLKKVNRTLIRCCESECFHIIPYSHNSDVNFSSQSFKTLKTHNTYTPVLKRGLHIADVLGIKLDYCYYDDIELATSVDFSNYFIEIENILEKLVKEREETESLLLQHQTVLAQVEQLSGLSANLEDIFAMKYVRVRFGRLPLDSYPKLKFFEDKNFIFQPFEKQDEYIWGAYFTPNSECVIIDDIFKSLYFERVRFPSYLEGTPIRAISYIETLIKKESSTLDIINAQLEKLHDDNVDYFIKVFCKLKALNDSHELRDNVAVINNKFFLSGYIPQSEIKKFVNLIEDIETVQVQVMPHNYDASVPPPVRLKNNWFTKPFEMFVGMYGLPGYGRIDPTPFVAITYFIIYGIMFGDLGQGIVVSLIGLLLHLWKKVKLAPIIMRIGISSAFFGVMYGSVFGSEEIIEPIFKHREIYELLGFNGPPKDIFEVSSMLLISALAIGILIIVITMVLNIVGSIRTRDFKNGVLGASGFVGLVFYVSVIAGAAMQLMFGMSVFTPPYVICLIILPLALLFFREPLTELFGITAKNIRLQKVNKNALIVNTVKTYSDAISKVETQSGDDFSLEQLIDCKYIKYQYGTLDADSYEKLDLYSDKKFFFFPFESTLDEVKGIYMAPITDFPAIDKIMTSMGFIKEKMPAHLTDIKREVKKMGVEERLPEAAHEKKSVGNFIIEGVIELFESALTYVTNTMSFLRVGGFILSHAGLMLVVNILAEKGGAPGTVGWILVQIIGNLIVIGMEGFLVGIQVLRLEFYEMFSRFYEGKGKPFKPIVIDYKNEN